ncbi:hypothetical protein KV557_07745 [Kitasatospora aureofaciens]|uniref:hypothetical protein n=1 Tax=Kitasatospora aureofaciens TaxID=1894 RepID=UPI001C462D78|nr:hypothetical protein [Kitasatospora aureofaciens]MBV6697014.1 hypothetical protein [Kitasatospora aureofaciens]
MADGKTASAERRLDEGRLDERLSAERLVVLRPATVAVPTPDGLFVRTLRGEHTLDAPALGRTWPRLAGHLETGIDPARLPRSLVDALLDTGAAVLVPPGLAASDLPWHRYALAWAADPAAAIERIAGTAWEAVGGRVETGAVQAAAREWGLPGVLPARPGPGLTLSVRTGGVGSALRMIEAKGGLLVELVGAERPAAELPPTIAPPVRAVAAAAVLHAALALASGPGGWHWPEIPVSIDPRTLTLTGAAGTSSR